MFEFPAYSGPQTAHAHSLMQLLRVQDKLVDYLLLYVILWLHLRCGSFNSAVETKKTCGTLSAGGGQSPCMVNL